LDKKQVLLLQIQFPKDFRVLMPNETYYQAYDDKGLWTKLQRDYEMGEYSEDNDDDDE
jgi:hypothetical protein